ncbi:MAG: HYR domain-containing protein [Saprospiraceae bacterium]|nr:HYR domain-containing protein [Saprospiraceae bacterium]
MFHCGFHRLLAAILCLLSVSLFGQIPTFQKAYIGYPQDLCLWGMETKNGFLLAGRTRPSATTNYDGLLIRTDPQGKIIWYKNYGSNITNETFWSVDTTDDGGFFVFGDIQTDSWLVKVDSTGEELWQKRLGEAFFNEDPNGTPVISVSDGCVVSGTITQNQPPLGVRSSFVVRVNNQGETLWSRRYTTTMPSIVRMLAVYHATDSMLYAFSASGRNTGLVALNPSNGDIIKAVEYSHPHDSLICRGLQPTPDGNFVLAGHTYSPDPNAPTLLWLLKVRPNGQIIWSKAYPFPLNQYDSGYLSHFSALSDGGFILSSAQVNSPGSVDWRMLMKLDSNGDALWKKAYTYNNGANEFFKRCFEISDGGLAAVSSLRISQQPNVNALTLIKTNADGEIEGCCAQKRDIAPAVDFPIEVIPISYLHEDYLPFTHANLTPTFQVSFTDTSICTIYPRPTLHDTLRFCPGESVTVGDSTYTQPATVSLLIPSATDDCDTLATYTLEHEAPDPNAALQLDCPADISVQANVPTIVHYNEPTAWSDCNCPDLTLVRTSGPASGAAFPLGATSVCYQADDACANSRACCFTVTLAPAPPPPSDACDTKTSGCLQFELLQVNRDYAQNWAYHVRLTNSCADAVQYAYLQVPKGLQALAPINDIVYTTANGHTFTARNPNFSPFYSVRYHFAAATLSSGQSETFRYVLPQQADVKYIHAAARLFSGAFVETHLNTFSCPVGTEPQPKPEAGERGDYGGGSTLRVYPNPVSAEEALFIEGGDMEGSDFVLRDLTGRLVLEASVTGSQVRVGEAKLANGLYFFNVLKNGLSVGSGKVVVVR